MNDSCKRHTKNDGSWWETDARGISLFRCCCDCLVERLKTIRPVFLTQDQRELIGAHNPRESYEQACAENGERLDDYA